MDEKILDSIKDIRAMISRAPVLHQVSCSLPLRIQGKPQTSEQDPEPGCRGQWGEQVQGQRGAVGKQMRTEGNQPDTTRTPPRTPPTSGLGHGSTLLQHICNLSETRVDLKLKQPYLHMVPIRIQSGCQRETACTTLVDSGNVWTNVMSKRLFHKMGFNEKDDLKIVPGNRPSEPLRREPT